MKKIEEYDYMECSHHSLVRATQRLGWTVKKAQAMMKKAFEKGKSYECFKGREREYLLSKAETGAYVVVYNGCLFVYNEQDICLTTYKLPSWFGKKAFFSNKEPIRNAKKYARHYGYAF